MARFSTDFRLGQSLYATLPVDKNLDVQKLRSLLLDLASSDTELASAFSLLLSHSIFLSSLSSKKELSSIQVCSLQQLAVSNLSSHLSARISDFLEGYASNFLPSPASPFPSVSLVQEVIPPTVLADVPASSFAEPPTVYADPIPVGSPTVSPGTGSNDFQRSVLSSIPQVSIKLLLFSIALSVVAFSFFRVKAFCEPLGICKSASSKSDQPDKVSKPVVSTPRPSSVQNQVAAPLPTRSPTQSYTPSTNPPDRDVPLW